MTLSLRKLKNIDICVATGSETVSICERLFKNSKKYYLIQGFETWVMGEEKLFQTYNKGFRNIVVSSWLKDLVDKHSDTESILIKNPIDLSIYYPINPIDKRTPHTIGLLYHSNEDKGLKYSLESLRVLKYKYPDLKVFMFGTSEPKEEIPGLVEYIKNATQEETVRLYNEVSVFMCSAIVEGYGLTAMEAMACGAAVASSNYEGIHEYGIEGYNCLLSPVKDIDSMVNNVSKFFDDDQFRILIANQGVQSLQSFDWEMAYIKFKNVIDN